ncbi:DUF1467 domain-containing protein [Acuticoccus sediminis]|uniref:DUF1467 domain-containing protein n=1 Tax=Acuticoccus sediminis TaxID=2184697 RepID=A0A8B2NY09_9HYPH|nr:DUF1467 family protein [Acuticoccus sediminis]RAI00668.1 DUF1467 domain-containing protein [Acuticoccus sediminis]
MDPVSAIAIFFIIWWLVFFPVLTFGDRRTVADEDLVAGADPGAPARTGLRRRVIVTTVISVLVFIAVYLVLNSGITLDDLPLPKPPPVPEYENA